MNDGMSNYTFDFESDSEDENKEKQTKQTEECLNNYRGVFNNYREVSYNNVMLIKTQAAKHGNNHVI